MDEVMLLLVGLAAVVFVEGWLTVITRHLMADCSGTPFVTALFSLLVRACPQLCPSGGRALWRGGPSERLLPPAPHPPLRRSRRR